MASVLDPVLLVVLLLTTVQGYRLGLVRSLGSVAGAAAGVVAAALLAPGIGAVVRDDSGRVVATLVAALVLLLLGHAVGAGIGSALGRLLRRGPLGPVDRLLGAAARLVIGALALSMVASLAAGLGVPAVARPVAGSVVLRTIAGATPEPVASAFAQLRSAVLSSGIPSLVSPLGVPGRVRVPAPATSRALGVATASVVKITGRAPACGQEQSGSGFVVARDRVLTNAHVVAGVARPVVLTRDGRAVEGRVVVFDPRRDLAVVAVTGLRTAPLRLAGEARSGQRGVVAGYPFGGPFTRSGAEVVRTGPVRVPDVQGAGRTVRQVATLAAEVQPGDSGGPLLDVDGEVLGVVFARSSDQRDLGYAMTRAEFGGTASRAPAATAAVPTGTCDRD